MMNPKRAARYDISVPKLDVELRDLLVGAVGESGETDVRFKYRPEIVMASTGKKFDPLAISVRLPVSEEPYGHGATLAFFDNLLLESDTRGELAMLARRDTR